MVRKTQSRLVLLTVAVWSVPTVLNGQERAPQSVEADIPGVVKAGTAIVLIKDGLAGADDPIGAPDGSVLFSEPNANRVLKLGLDGKVSTFLEDTDGGLGMALDSTGRLIQAQSQDGKTKIAVIDPPGRRAILADNYEGRPFSRPNDITVDKKGGVYFTDPGLTGVDRERMERANGGKPLPPRLPPAVYYMAPGGKVTRVADGIERPNGITLSRDEQTLYVNNTNGIYLFAFDVQPDGTLRNRRNLATYVGRSQESNGLPGVLTYADGLVIDSEGRLYGLTEAGVEVFTSEGKPLGIIPVRCNGRRCQGLAFGGPNKGTLYLCGFGAFLKVQLIAKGYTGRAK